MNKISMLETDMSNPENLDNTKIEYVRLKKQEAIDSLNEKITAFNKTKFLITKDKVLIRKIKNFLKDDAPWKFTESFFLQQILEDINTPNDPKIEGLYFDARNIETLQYFISKIEGVGNNLKEVDSLNFSEYVTIIQTLQEVIETLNPEKAKLDAHKKAIDDINFYLNSLLHGVEVSEDDLIKVYQLIGLEGHTNEPIAE